MKKLAHGMYKVQLGLGFLFISIFLVSIVVQVFCRYLGVTVMWTGEVSTNSFIWTVFMGAGAMTYENKHFAFSSLKDKLSYRNRELLNIFNWIIILIFSISILYFGYQIVTKFWNYQWIQLSFIKMGYTYLCIPFLGFSVSVYAFNEISGHIKNVTRGGKK
jgi:TRAP-type C4-dicarboxylate transport system permease small subunit